MCPVQNKWKRTNSLGAVNTREDMCLCSGLSVLCGVSCSIFRCIPWQVRYVDREFLGSESRSFQ